jgi:hypothetical protein
MKKNDKKIKQKLKGRKPGQRFVFSRQSLIASENIAVLPGAKDDVEDIAKEDVKAVSSSAKENYLAQVKKLEGMLTLIFSYCLLCLLVHFAVCSRE